MKSAICSPSLKVRPLRPLAWPDKAAIPAFPHIEIWLLRLPLPAVREAATQTHSDVGAGAEMLKLALSRKCRARGRLQHKPIAAAESRLRERRRGDAKTDSPQSNYNGRLQHKPIGVAESPATGESRRGDVCQTRNPITGAPRAREAAAQTHSCCGISTAGAQARRCKNLFSAIQL